MSNIEARVWSNEYCQYLTPYGYPNGHSDLWLKCEDGNIYDLQGSYEYDSGVGLEEIQLQGVVIEQYLGLPDKTGKGMAVGDRVLDNVGRIWIIDYLASKAAFIFRWERDPKQYQTYARFNKDQRPLEIIGTTHEAHL